MSVRAQTHSARDGVAIIAVKGDDGGDDPSEQR